MPHGFSGLSDGGSIVNESEMTGATTVGGHTWVNEDHGDSVHDIENLDQVTDEQVIDTEEDHVTSVSVEVEVNVDIYTEEKVVETVTDEPLPEEPVTEEIVEKIVVIEEPVPTENPVKEEEVVFNIEDILMPGPVIIEDTEENL